MITAVWPPIRRAIIRALRANLDLVAVLPGDWSEGVAPQGTTMPYGTISLVPAPILYDWTGRVHELFVDVVIFAESQGDAARIDQLVLATLQDAKLQVPDLTVLTVRRTGDFALVDVNPEGKRIFESGGTYLVRAAQSDQIASATSLPVIMSIS
jgi:hypothetical protein